MFPKPNFNPAKKKFHNRADANISFNNNFTPLSEAWGKMQWFYVERLRRPDVLANFFQMLSFRITKNDNNGEKLVACFQNSSDLL